MTKRTLPAAPAGRPCARVSCELSPMAMERWNSSLQAAASDDENTISILDVIGADYWGEGMTAKRMAGLLRAMGGADVVVNINSPGGDMFEGLAIYNQLREYSGHVTVKVIGIAASAASIIAMAADELQIGRAAFLMIHNCWVAAVGNRHDLARVAQDMEPFDRAMQDIYSVRSGLSGTEITAMMDSETYIGGADAVDKGLADALLEADAVLGDPDSPAAALRKLDALLAKANTPRAERRRLLKALKGSTPGAAVTINPEILAGLESALSTLVPAC
ncbi:Clp protease ClpP [Plesiomonas shigelloides]|uniref:head maturation protease, ClpP-related n=1 Tax=Plesiomonas shigelloides TaxID=703 RepID=UPI0012628AA2|nr:head maturation protease, ClpP-related [Plesiomonas shigelloides]KAB7674108.1 Clp protease ClpP [Plesiomonas shigelloides]